MADWFCNPSWSIDKELKKSKCHRLEKTMFAKPANKNQGKFDDFA